MACKLQLVLATSEGAATMLAAKSVRSEDVFFMADRTSHSVLPSPLEEECALKRWFENEGKSRALAAGKIHFHIDSGCELTKSIESHHSG